MSFAAPALLVPLALWNESPVQKATPRALRSAAAAYLSASERGSSYQHWWMLPSVAAYSNHGVLEVLSHDTPAPATDAPRRSHVSSARHHQTFVIT